MAAHWDGILVALMQACVLPRRFNAAAALLQFHHKSLQAVSDDEPVDSETKTQQKSSNGSSSTGRSCWPLDLFVFPFFLSVSGQISVLADTSFPLGDSREGE